MRRWLARLGFSMLVLACVAFWSAYQRNKVEGASTAVVVRTIAGSLLAAAGFAGIRERHRIIDDEQPPVV